MLKGLDLIRHILMDPRKRLLGHITRSFKGPGCFTKGETGHGLLYNIV